MRKIVGLVALSLACSAQAGAADTLLTYTRESPEMAFNGRVTGGRETVHVLVGPGRVRIDEPRRATILRADEGKLYFVVNPQETKRRERISPDQNPSLRTGEIQFRELGPRSYAVRFPVKLRDELPAETYTAIVESEPSLALQVRTVDRQRTRKIGNWQAAEHRIELTDPAGHVRAAATVWTTTELPSKTFAPLQQLQEAVAAMNPRHERLLLAQAIDKLPGVPVRVETTFDELAGAVTRSLELGAIQEKAATSADYQPPKDAEQGEFVLFYGTAYHDL
jgi:hypothetical protein